MLFNMELYVYMKSKSMLKYNIQKAYYLVLAQCIELLKIKPNHSKGWIEESTKMDVLDIIKIINSVIFQSEDQKYLTLFLHQAKINLYTLHHVNMSNADYLDIV